MLMSLWSVFVVEEEEMKGYINNFDPNHFCEYLANCVLCSDVKEIV